MNSPYLCSPAHLCRFLQVSGNSWHNALYIECNHCPRAISSRCSDLLCVFDDSAQPVLIPKRDAELLWDTTIDKADCLTTMRRAVFIELYKGWLFGHLQDPAACPLSGLYEELPPSTPIKSPLFPNL